MPFRSCGNSNRVPCAGLQLETAELTTMSQNKKKQTAKQSSGTKPSSKSEPTQPDEQKSNESGANSTQENVGSPAPDQTGDEQGTNLVHEGNQQVTTQQVPLDGDGAPQTGEQGDGGTGDQPGDTEPADGPADDEDGTQDPEQDPEQGGTPPSGDAAGGNSSTPDGITGGETKGDTSTPANDGKPVDANTAKVNWGNLALAEEAAPDGLILDPDEEVRFEGEHEGNLIRVTKDVYRKVYPRGAKKPSYVLLYRKDALVSAQGAQQQ